ncbi:uncharacterized protein LOC129750835 [Uranotaenia lowii]|uniref:uncharacterized protein LOC129750835 n=1 Tax=Uranotaenia lowii TaxID=190385 RepID=UPI002479CB7A|nr:uncharacterized protein LOC129750835 [Uranotaenia lowii]
MNIFGPIILLTAIAVCCSGQGGPEDCMGARCETYEHINTLWCHRDPAKYCQCRPNSGTWSWEPRVMPCAPGTVFHFWRQVCVHPSVRPDDVCVMPEEEDEPTSVMPVCDQVPCNTREEREKLSCHEDSHQFCRCRPLSIDPVTWAAIAMPCAQGTAFSYRHQTCFLQVVWTNSCPP